MSVVLVCPACGHPHTLHRGSVPGTCDRCAAPFAEAARETVRAALAAEAAQRPLMLTVVMGFGAFWAGVVMIVFLFAVLGGGPYSVNDRLVTKGEFLGSMWPLVALVPVVGGIAWALWCELAPVRHFMFGCLLASMGLWIATPATSRTDRVVGTLLGALHLFGGGWYLYRKPNVVAWFSGLEARGVAARRHGGV